VSGFRRGVNEIFSLLECYTATIGSRWEQQTFLLLHTDRDWFGRYAGVVGHLAVENVAQGAHLHRIGIRRDPYRMLCSLRELTDRNNLGQNRTI
jgi:hypothetical protein